MRGGPNFAPAAVAALGALFAAAAIMIEHSPADVAAGLSKWLPSAEVLYVAAIALIGCASIILIRIAVRAHFNSQSSPIGRRGRALAIFIISIVAVLVLESTTGAFSQFWLSKEPKQLASEVTHVTRLPPRKYRPPADEDSEGDWETRFERERMARTVNPSRALRARYFPTSLPYGHYGIGNMPASDYIILRGPSAAFNRDGGVARVLTSRGRSEETGYQCLSGALIANLCPADLPISFGLSPSELTPYNLQARDQVRISFRDRCGEENLDYRPGWFILQVPGCVNCSNPGTRNYKLLGEFQAYSDELWIVNSQFELICSADEVRVEEARWVRG